MAPCQSHPPILKTRSQSLRAKIRNVKIWHSTCFPNVSVSAIFAYWSRQTTSATLTAKMAAAQPQYVTIMMLGYTKISDIIFEWHIFTSLIFGKGQTREVGLP